MASIVAGVGAGVSIGLATPAGFLWGAILIFGFNVLDCADGMLARLRGQGSPLGYILDGLAGYIGTAAIVIGMGQAVATRFGHPLFDWTLAVAAGLSLAWWCAVVDGLRLEWSRRVYGKREDRAAEMKSLTEAAERWRAEGGHWLGRTLVGAYGIYVKLWEGRTPRDRAEDPVDALPVDAWVATHRPILRLAVAAGPTMQLTAMIAAAIAGRPEWILWGAVTFGNAWGATVLLLRLLARRRLLAQAAASA
jgi:hypothetical protein